MARVIYALLALAAGALITGFVVSTTILPLLASSVFSAVILVLILYGWSKRLRESGAFDAEPGEDVEELTTFEYDEPLRRQRFRRPGAKATTSARIRRTKARPRKPAPAWGLRRVMVIPGASKFHAKGCRFARGDDLREVTEAVARRRGYVPCGICLRD